jgi:hypothetical protein
VAVHHGFYFSKGAGWDSEGAPEKMYFLKVQYTF